MFIVSTLPLAIFSRSLAILERPHPYQDATGDQTKKASTSSVMAICHIELASSHKASELTALP